MTFGERIRELRAQRNFSQRELAQKVGIDFTYISKMENNKLDHTPSVETIIRLARALETDELELMELANKMPPILEKLAKNQDAMRFFRRATETIKTAEGWKDLLNYLDKQQKSK